MAWADYEDVLNMVCSPMLGSQKHQSNISQTEELVSELVFKIKVSIQSKRLRL